MRIGTVRQTDRSLMRKETRAFAVITTVGAVALALGLALIIFAHYHERAYIFLVLGAGGFIGGLAGMIVAGQKARVVLDYGLIAMGFVTMVVGLNYVIDIYGKEPHVARGYFLITLSMIALLTGMMKELVVQPKKVFVSIWSVIVLGSMGIALVIFGSMYLTKPHFYDNTFLLLVLVLCQSKIAEMKCYARTVCAQC